MHTKLSSVTGSTAANVYVPVAPFVLLLRLGRSLLNMLRQGMRRRKRRWCRWREGKLLDWPLHGLGRRGMVVLGVFL